MSKKIFIYVERNGAEVLSVYHELLGKARELRGKWTAMGEEAIVLCAVTLGPVTSGEESSILGSGADVWYRVEAPALCEYNPDLFMHAAAELCRAEDPDIFLIGSTVEGTELAPALGVRLTTGVAAHCMDLRVAEDGTFIQVVPAFGGKVLGEIITPNHRPRIATVKPGLFLAEKKTGYPKPEVISFKPPGIAEVKSGIELFGIHTEPRTSLPVDSADIIFCGGYGVGGDENWKLLEKIAAKFEKSAVGCTRPALDEGWCEDESSMIGTSGRTVRPRLYFGVGISGATHHLCGTTDADVIISVNRDENAEIFNASDYKIVEDSGKILTAMAAQLGIE